MCPCQPPTPFMQPAVDSAYPLVIWVAQARMLVLPQNQASGLPDLHGIKYEKMSQSEGLA